MGSFGRFAFASGFAEPIGSNPFTLTQLGQGRLTYLGVGSFGRFAFASGFAEPFGSNPFTLTQLGQGRFTYPGARDFEQFALGRGFAEPFGFARLGLGTSIVGGARGFRCLSCFSRSLSGRFGPDPGGSTCRFSVGHFGFAGAGEVFVIRRSRFASSFPI
ncbi:hypothetical protein AB0F91_02300 [Amycolatopsis sp. NPDC023774]|uniref:hypothetical protein n=1 Tax=Amycolatopsis sp. NPDC023774 TaxID=3155015 RepID=UPI0033EAF908